MLDALHSLQNLLDELTRQQVHLRLEEGKLRYSAPKGALTPALREQIAAQRTALVAWLEQQGPLVPAARPASPAAPRLLDTPAPISVQPRSAEGLPLSAAQQRFWFLDRLGGGRVATYNMVPVVIRLSGPLDRHALETALRHLLQRHEVLRTVFQDTPNGAVQRCVPVTEVPIRWLDIRTQAPEEQAETLSHWIRTEAATPFDLEVAPSLLRLLFLQVGAQEYRLILTMHHIAADGWSIGIFVQELSQLYRSALTGRPFALPPLPIQYADFAYWEREWLRSPALEQQRQYWLAQLRDAPAFLELPTDHPRPRVKTRQGHTVHFSMPAAFNAQLAAFCRQKGVTPFMVLLAAYAVLLSRYTGQEDLVIGTPISVRPHPQTEDLIGLFLNTLALRIDLHGAPDFHTLMQRVKQCALQGFEHREAPFDQVLQGLGIERSLSHTPVFQVLFALQNAPMGEVALEGLTLTPLPNEEVHAPFDLVLSLEEAETGLQGKLRYSTDLFTVTTIERMVGHWQRLLSGLVGTPDQPVHQIPWLSPEEDATLRAWSYPRQTFPVADTDNLVERFVAQVRAQPDAVAVAMEEASLTYGDLNRRANRLAHALLQAGVQTGARVGLYMERSLDLIVGLLGILKVGAAYVPLDPAYPDDRLRFMASDAGLAVVVGAPERLAERTWDTPICGIDPDPSVASLPDGSSVDPVLSIPPATIAYVIYTSGSTGVPKGVQISHANVLRLLSASEEGFGFAATDVWTLFHSYAFDFSVWEIWGALAYGGRLEIVPYWISRSPDAFLRLLRERQVTVLNQTPSAFRQLIEADRQMTAPEVPLALRWVIFGGEALEPRSLLPWVERHGLEQPQLINMYGITETTVHVTYHRLTQHDLEQGRSPIGRALPDLGIDLRDRHGQPVPIGVAGELLVRGDGVAQGGYWVRPALNAERFVTAESLGLPGGDARMYRSGDLARWRADGTLEYLGRIDLQVKIRGFRIELGEIEKALLAFPGVTEAVADAPRDADGEARLVAYVTLATPEAGQGQEQGQEQGQVVLRALRTHLKERLPEHMVPGILRVVAQIPLTTNGKVDKRALAQAIDAAPDSAAQPFTPPATPLEAWLAETFQSVLGQTTPVGREGHFFELGGDSIKGAILANRLQERLGTVVYVVALFEAPTVQELAIYLKEQYPEAALRIEGTDGAGSEPARAGDAAAEPPLQVDEVDVQRLAMAVHPLPAHPVRQPRNPRAIFVLSPPRSGSTLLRVLLGGHPALFAPPELELLGFNRLDERARVCSGRDAFWLEGNLRALMEAQGLSADTAKQWMAEREARGMTVQDYYQELQGWLGGRLLVDKSPSYALDPAVLARAEAYFTDPLYIHLHRHPCGMIASFAEARLEQIFFRYPHPYRRRELAELLWVHSHRNIEAFLAGIPAERQIRISFEDMTADPEGQMRRLCAMLGIDYDPNMLDIHARSSRRSRMTDGIHAESRMLGDIKFHTHAGIDPATAWHWREQLQEDSLGTPARLLGRQLGYDLPLPTAAASGPDPAQRSASGQPPLVALPRTADTVLLPAFQQQRLWFLDRLEGAGVAYNMPIALRLRGTLDLDALRGSLADLSQRHEILRTALVTRDGVPVLSITGQTLNVVVEDLRTWPEADRDAEAQRRIQAEAQQPFDLEKGPLIRARLLRLADDVQALVVTLHHVVSDGWSIGIFAQDWTALYQARHRGTVATLPDLPVQYADYAAWQRQWLQGAELERQVAYWRTQLAGAPALLELPTDHPRPAVQGYRGASLPLTLAAPTVAALRALGERSGASLYMVLLAAYAILLARYSGQTDILIGSPTANRGRREIEPLIGFFANTLVLRVPVVAEQSFQQLLADVRRTALDAYAHQEIPFERLVEVLRPERTLSHAPLFQVLFSLQNAPAALPELPGLAVEVLNQANPVAKFDLTLALTERAHHLDGFFEFNTDLFEPATIARMAEHFMTLLDAIVAHPGEAVGYLPLLNARHLQQQWVEWNATAQAGPGLPSWTFPERFAGQVQRTPQAVALQAQGRDWTYQQLDVQANRCAHALITAGVAPGDRVAVLLGRHAGLLIGLLGVLKAGAAYVPLDPNYPRERLEFILQDVGARLLLTEPDLMDRLDSADLPIRWLQASGESTDPMATAAPPGQTVAPEQTAVAPDITVHPEDLAYCIYTSGSTGLPKGVLLEHRNLANFLQSMAEVPGMSPQDVLLAVTTVSFDIAALELFLPLLVGAQVVLADEATVVDGQRLAQVLQAASITVMQATPATWRLLLASGWTGSPQLRVFCGGEAFPVDLAQTLRAGCAEVWNLYGPTETTIWSLCQRVLPAPEVPASTPALSAEQTEGQQRHIPASASVPIGRPIANTTVYVLDSLQQPLPIGVAGELYIGGLGVARGYHQRPELTAERFVPEVLSTRLPNTAGGGAGPITTGRLYRTGDRVRYHADGTLEYLGRMDFQVKVRGFRIELGEIETVLAAQDGVSVAAAAVQRDADGNARLLAFYVPQAGAEPDPLQLREQLRNVLPEYMVPSRLLRLDHMPLTPNGKIDRRALPLTEALEGVGTHGRIPPRDAVELVLVQIWESVLGQSGIGVRDDFFALGGYSLVAVRMMAQISERFGRILPLATLFRSPTVEALAGVLRRQPEASAAAWSSLVPLQTQGHSRPLFCAAGAGGNVLYFHALAQALGGEQPFYGLQPAGLDGHTPPHTRIEDLTAQYVQEIRQVQPQGPYRLAGHSFGGWVAHAMARQLLREGASVEILVLLDTPAPEFVEPTGLDWEEAQWLVQIASIAGHLYGVDLGVTQAALDGLSVDAQMSFVHAQLCAHGILPPGADLALFRGFYAVYKANLAATYAPDSEAETGKASAPVRIPKVVVLRARDLQPGALASARAQEIHALAALGWEKRSDSMHLRVISVPGDHLTMLVSPQVEALAQSLLAVLAEASVQTTSVPSMTEVPA